MRAVCQSASLEPRCSAPAIETRVTGPLLIAAHADSQRRPEMRPVVLSIVREALSQSSGRVPAAAAALSVGRTWLWRYLAANPEAKALAAPRGRPVGLCLSGSRAFVLTTPHCPFTAPCSAAIALEHNPRKDRSP